ncbi:MAG: hypothetical protein IKZ97_01730 [Butyrivibrio sp.]|nr:hypothetical protein [Butyrivibrio sp.]
MGEKGEENYYYNNFNYNKTHNELDKHVSLASFAMFLGLIGIPLGFLAYPGIIMGGVAIILALLSKGTLEKTLPQAKRAIVFGAIAVIGGYYILFSSVHAIMTDPETRREVNTISERLYDRSFDDMLKDMGINAPSLDAE